MPDASHEGSSLPAQVLEQSLRLKGSGLVSCINVPLLAAIRQTVEVARTVKAVDDSARELQQRLAIPVVFEDVFSAVASGSHTVNFTENSGLRGRAIIDLDTHER